MRASPVPRCLAIFVALALPLCATTAVAEGPPVVRPHDLVIGRITYAQNNQNVRYVQVGMPVAIACNYVVDEVVSPLAFKIQPWQGHIEVGGPAAQSFVFQGVPAGGQHEAHQTWTPSAVGKTPISCVLNPGFEGVEASGGNNRWNETIDVVGEGDEPPPADVGVQPSNGLEAMAERGKLLAEADPMAAALRDEMLSGFDIGMGGTEGNSLWGPGQQTRLNSLSPVQQVGYKVASTYSLDRNRHPELAEVGLSIATADPELAKARAAEADARYSLGFDIATGIFGDPKLGAQGNTLADPGSLGIRDSLSPVAQSGFNAAMRIHLRRRY